MCPPDARGGRQRGGACGQMQEFAAGKLWCPPRSGFDMRHHPTSLSHPPRGPLSLDVESAPGTRLTERPSMVHGGFPGVFRRAKLTPRIASSENVTRWRHWNRQSGIRATRRFRSAFDETGCGRVGPSIARAGHSPRRWSSGRGGERFLSEELSGSLLPKSL